MPSTGSAETRVVMPMSTDRMVADFMMVCGMEDPQKKKDKRWIGRWDDGLFDGMVLRWWWDVILKYLQASQEVCTINNPDVRSETLTPTVPGPYSLQGWLTPTQLDIHVA